MAGSITRVLPHSDEYGTFRTSAKRRVREPDEFVHLAPVRTNHGLSPSMSLIATIALLSCR